MAMVEYGLGLACVAFTAVVALSYLGYDIADIIEDVLENTTLGNEHKPPEPVPFVTKNILGT
jgi:hypothetical protein